MKITSIVDNNSTIGLPVEHGLSLYINMNDGENILFDTGQTSLFSENATRLGLSVSDIEMVIISHGHYDHGGGLETFLSINDKANVYIHKDAFQSHYSIRENEIKFIGIDPKLCNNKRIIKCENVTQVRRGITLFADVQGSCFYPKGNRLLYGPDQTINDTFSHEQNLIIQENNRIVLIAGCAHRGIVNIIAKSIEIIGTKPTHVLAGMHLTKSGLNDDEEQQFIRKLAERLKIYRETKFYTMHCTGIERYTMLKSYMGNQIEYLSCGESIEI